MKIQLQIKQKNMIIKWVFKKVREITDPSPFSIEVEVNND